VAKVISVAPESSSSMRNIPPTQALAPKWVQETDGLLRLWTPVRQCILGTCFFQAYQGALSRTADSRHIPAILFCSFQNVHQAFLCQTLNLVGGEGVAGWWLRLDLYRYVLLVQWGRSDMHTSFQVLSQGQVPPSSGDLWPSLETFVEVCVCGDRRGYY
jgi:hypothetical protein